MSEPEQIVQESETLDAGDVQTAAAEVPAAEPVLDGELAVESDEPADGQPADGEAAEPTEEELAAAEAERLAAEKAEREAAERLARMEAEREQAEARSSAAVAAIGAGAGFITSAGTYYDVDAPRRVDYQYADLVRAQAEAEAAPEGAEGDQGAEGAEGAAAAPEGAEPEAAPADPDDFARRVARLTDSVVKQSLHREIFYKTLVFCEQSRPLPEIEAKIATFSEFPRAAASQYHFVKVLEQAGGLQRFELDEQGEVVLPEQKAGLTEDEVDDLVAGYAFMTTDVGMAVVEQHTPRARIIELLGLVPERKDAYVELMGFVADEPRTYAEISQLFSGRDVLWRVGPDGEPQRMQPSVFVDKLEAAGGIEYRDGWMLTEEGKGFLEELLADRG